MAETQEETAVGGVFVSNYPPYDFWLAKGVEAAREAFSRPPDAAVPAGLYIHIPFCRRRCKFCYFRVVTDKSSDEVQRYVDAVVREIGILAAQPALAGRRLGFIYFGGGTPSYLSVRHLERLVNGVRGAFPWTGAEGPEEITFECEPGTLTQPKVEAIRSLGVTRLSLGVENFNDAILEENGRAHLSAEIDRALPWIAAAGFAQLNIDLIAGMVGERWETWRESVRRTVDMAPDSVTIYQMELPPNTAYSGDLRHGLPLEVADWPLKRAWHDHAIEALLAAGYEISSAYTMVRRGSGARFVYRDALWHGADMLGAGVSSFGHLSGVHVQNTSSWDDYLALTEAGRLPLARGLALTPEERMTREFILQLKLGRLDAAPFQARHGVDVLRHFAAPLGRLEEEGLAVLSPSGVRLTRDGLLRVDHFLPSFYAPPYRQELP